MITVTVSINGNPILCRSARNVKRLEGDLCEYKVDDGRLIKHYQKNGAANLAIEMLEGIEEI